MSRVMGPYLQLVLLGPPCRWWFQRVSHVYPLPDAMIQMSNMLVKRIETTNRYILRKIYGWFASRKSGKEAMNLRSCFLLVSQNSPMRCKVNRLSYIFSFRFRSWKHTSLIYEIPWWIHGGKSAPPWFDTWIWFMINEYRVIITNFLLCILWICQFYSSSPWKIGCDFICSKTLMCLLIPFPKVGEGRLRVNSFFLGGVVHRKTKVGDGPGKAQWLCLVSLHQKNTLQ